MKYTIDNYNKRPFPSPSESPGNGGQMNENEEQSTVHTETNREQSVPANEYEPETVTPQSEEPRKMGQPVYFKPSMQVPFEAVWS